MNIKLHKPVSSINGIISLSGSKSISNRVLIIKALSGLNFNIENLSNSDDTKFLEKALLQIVSGDLEEINIGHAGTDMRFLTSFLSIKPGKRIITGSDRIKQRPIKELVDVLRKMGANISYADKENYPPLLIDGCILNGGRIVIDGTISSQFISSLLLVAPYFKSGLEIFITGKIVSKPYIDMTVKVMQDFGASLYWKEDTIIVKPIPYTYSKSEYVVESDWSSASYYYSLLALSNAPTKLILKKLFNNSIQADSVCEEIYASFGISTEFLKDEVILTKLENRKALTRFEYDFINCPDIAQTVICTCVGLGVSFRFTGLSTLKVKETDRIFALKNEFKKVGVNLLITDHSISRDDIEPINESQEIIVETYHDHRMAMSFATLCAKYSNITIIDSEVVSKSYPLFWEDLKIIGISVEEIK
jgi:3-phosphoshikimate 1-carboxyvinyltransferase